MSYMTRQQQAVLQCIEACPDGRATAMELMQRLRQSGQTVGLSHGFAINPRRTMFYGLCEKCREAAQ